MFNIASAMLLQ